MMSFGTNFALSYNEMKLKVRAVKEWLVVWLGFALFAILEIAFIYELFKLGGAFK